MKLFSKNKKTKSNGKKEGGSNLCLKSNETNNGINTTSKPHSANVNNMISPQLEEGRSSGSSTNNPVVQTRNASRTSNASANSNSKSSPRKTNDQISDDTNRDHHRNRNNENNKEIITNDPTAFWLAWNERRQACFDKDGNILHEAGCNCFEGMGSVM